MTILLPPKAKLTNVRTTQGKFILDREGRLSLSINLDHDTKRYNALLHLDGTWATSWFDSFGAGGQSDNVIDLEIDDVSVSFETSKRGSISDAPAGTVAVTDTGVILIGKPYDGAEGSLVLVSLSTRSRGERGGDIVHILSGWVIRGYRQKVVAFELRQDTP